MIDVETLGTRPGSVILSIGAVAFDVVLPTRSIYLVVDPVDAQKRGLTIDAGTVTWWLRQSDEARRALFAESIMTLYEALTGLSAFVAVARTTGSPLRVWAKPPSFDIAMLKAAYDACELSVPWSHRDERDARTLLDLARVSSDAVPFEGVEHNALDDAKHQAKLATLALDRLEAERIAMRSRS